MKSQPVNRPAILGLTLFVFATACSAGGSDAQDRAYSPGASGAEASTTGGSAGTKGGAEAGGGGTNPNKGGGGTGGAVNTGGTKPSAGGTGGAANTGGSTPSAGGGSGGTAGGGGTGGTTAGSAGSSGGNPVDCSGIAANPDFELCGSGPDYCEGVYTNGNGCVAFCAAAGLLCVEAYGGDPQCDGPQLANPFDCNTPSGNQSDWCRCGNVGGSAGSSGAGGTAGTGGAPTWCVPSTNVPSGWSYLSNGVAKLGVNLSHGAAIGHFSTTGANVLDSADTGRYLQQSYYGSDIGGSWHGDPWPFNPVQGGSSNNDPSPVLAFCNDGTTLYAKTHPQDWGGTGLTPCTMEEWIRLDQDVAVVRFRFEYNGAWDNGEKDQEVPALFVRRDLENLTYYDGNSPWTGGGVSQKQPLQLEGGILDPVNFTESWLAYLDAKGNGVGLYSKGAHYAVSYRYKKIGQGSATSYFAFVDQFALHPGTVHDYTVFAKTGTLAQIRDAFYSLHTQGQ